MKKRILSIVLAVLMLVSVLPISALAADVEPPIAETGVSTKTSENTTGPKLEKSAQWVDEKAGIAKITIQVTGEQPTETAKKTDIVLVIDRSLSMTQNDRDWLKNAKQAAKAFAKKVLTGDPNVRIAVVAYAAKTINDWDFSSKLATVENNIDAINTNNVYYKGQWYADHDSLWSENWHGTNIQAGIHSARERLKKSDKDADKFMIVLADGAPNYRFTYKDWGIGTTFDLTDAQKRTYHINNWFSWLFYATSDAFNYNEVKNTEQYAYTAAASEAYAAKATDGITCYAIGYGIPQGNNEINALMYSIASTDAGFVNAGTDVNAITKVFSDIATDIQYKAHDVTLTDTMGAGFTYLANETYPSNPVVTPSAGNKTVTWDVADKLGDETKTLTFYVQYDKQNLTDAATLPTNTSASLSYKDNKGNAQPNITVASPEIENLAFTVTYLDETGTELTAPPYTKTHYWHGDTVAIKDGPAKDGYDFTGWTVTGVTPAEGAKSFDMPKNNVTLKANYTEKDYLLSTGVYYISDNVVPPDSVLYSYSSVGSPRLKKDAQVTLPDFVDVQDSEHDGVWKFRGWYEYYGLSTARKYEGTFTMPARDVSLDAVWTFQKNERVNVNYEYAVDDDCDGKYTLPTELTPPAAESIIKGRTATPKTLSEAEKTYSTTEGTWSFTGWTPEKHENVTEDVTFTGKWHFTPYERVNVDYEYAVDDDCDGKYTLPTELTPPAAESIIKGRTATPKTLSEAEKTYSTTEGTWSFTGWTPEKHENVTENVTFTGKWHFTENEPKETTYSIKYYRQDADGKYSNKPYYTRTMTDAGVPLKGNVGDTVKIEDLEPFYKEHYKGYEFDEDAENVRSLQLKADANENVLKLYYKAEALMTLDKDYVAYRDGEELDLSDGEELKAGDVIQYTITLKNTGTRNLTNVTVEDTFTGAEGELVFISGDAYEIDEDTGIISLKDTLKPGETVDIRADYEVQLNDSGWRITNEVLGDATELPPAGKPHASVTITPEALKNYEIHVSADKYVKSVKGTFNKDEEDVDFTFAVSSDKRGKNELDRFDITVDESVKAGETSSRFDGGITIRLTEEEFDDLKWETFEGDGKKYPVVYLREVKGSDKKMRYDTSVVTLYLLVPQVIVTSHDPIYKTTSLNAWVDPTDSTLWPEFTNVYGKESSSSDTVKVGPQLNRDDHVAYIMGYPDGTVQPKGEITRAEACTIFFRLLTDSSRDYYFSKTNDYTDVNAGDWFNNAISTLSNAGIVTGYNDGTFRPNQPITRGEMAKIIANFANLNKGTKSFTDLSGHWSKSYVELAAGNGWIAGYPDGSFRPDQKITRAETVTMINRVLERVPAKELRLLSRSIMLTFPDNNPGDWYYIAIQEASNSHEYQRSVYETTGDEMWTKLIDNVDWTKLEK